MAEVSNESRENEQQQSPKKSNPRRRRRRPRSQSSQDNRNQRTQRKPRTQKEQKPTDSQTVDRRPPRNRQSTQKQPRQPEKDQTREPRKPDTRQTPVKSRPPVQGKSVKRRRIGRIVTFVSLAVLLTAVLWQTMNRSESREVPYSEFQKTYVQENRIASVEISEDRLEARLRQDGQPRLRVNLGPMAVTPIVVDSLMAQGIEVKLKPTSDFFNTAVGALPYIAILAIIFLLFRQSQGGQKGVFNFGKSPARRVSEDVPSVTFEEVAGAEEAKQELEEIVEFLREPEKFRKLGGRIPKGVLMVGPPGTGKTYLARAVAGEAGVPFFTMSGSDFVEMFVGVGASRVRDSFEKAKQNAPCILFIDELDAVGRHRGAGLGGGHDEREQTLNQLLVEMDGFESTGSAVILMAATNRPDVLDPALLRPGRFDRNVVIDLPDVRGREGILRIHTRNIPLASDVNFGEIARGTPGLSGAEIQNMVNEAALLGARKNRKTVGMAEFELAKEKTMWGVERRSLVMSDEERRVTAVHEAGHALVAVLTPGADPVHKCSIVPRGRALGLTWYLPHEERHTVSRGWCMAKLRTILGGRAAESIVMNEVTNGAANDIETATSLAKRMVCEWGMSSRVGPVVVGGKASEVFIGKELTKAENLSEQSLQVVDAEIRRIVEEALQQARSLLDRNVSALTALSDALLGQEVLDREQIQQIVRTHEHLGKNDSPAPVIVEHPAPSTRKPRRDDTDAETASWRERRRQKEEEEERLDDMPVVTPAPEPEPEIEPEPKLEETPVEPVEDDNEPEREEEGRESDTPEYTVVTLPGVPRPTDIEYGRAPKRVRRHGLPAADVPKQGVSVESVVNENEMKYGRLPRPADETSHVRSLAKPKSSSEQSENARENEGTVVQGVSVGWLLRRKAKVRAAKARTRIALKKPRRVFRRRG